MRAVLLHHLYPDPAARATVIAAAVAAVRADDTEPVIQDRGALTVVLARAGRPTKRGAAA